MTLRSATKALVVLALALPVVQCVLIWVHGLVASMGDADGAAIIGHVGTACGVIWLISLVGLVITLALTVLNEQKVE